MDDPTETLRKALETSRNVRFGRGIVGKTGHLAIAVAIVWAVVCYRLSDNMAVNAALGAAGLIVTAFAIWWTKATQNYAERNPAQALLEGAEFLEYRRMEVEAKGSPPEVNPKQLKDAAPREPNSSRRIK